MASYDNNDPVVAEARKRLAERNGKASMLPAMIEKVRAEQSDKSKRGSAYDVYDGNATDATANNGTQLQRDDAGTIYRYNPQYDITTIETAGGQQATRKGDARPNAIDKYLDDILGEAFGSGNAQASVQGSGVSDAEYGTAPVIPVERGDMLPDPTQQQDASPSAEDSSNALRNLLIGGGGAAAAGYLLHRYLKGDGTTPDGQSTDVNPANGISPSQDPSTALQTTPEGRINQAHGNPERDAQIAGYIQQRNAGEGVGGLLDTFANDTVQSEEGHRVAAATEQPSENKSGKSGRVPNTGSQDAQRTNIMQQAADMTDVKAAVELLRKNGIDIQNDPEARRVFADIANARRAAGKAARSAARNAAKGM